MWFLNWACENLSVTHHRPPVFTVNDLKSLGLFYKKTP